jgi:hypothetical protein
MSLRIDVNELSIKLVYSNDETRVTVELILKISVFI